MKQPRHLHPTASSALQLLGTSIRAARAERHWTIAELADRVGVTAKTMALVERGDPRVAAATYFEAAALVGVPLYGGAQQLATELDRQQERVSLLPQRVRRATGVNDDF